MSRAKAQCKQQAEKARFDKCAGARERGGKHRETTYA